MSFSADREMSSLYLRRSTPYLTVPLPLLLLLLPALPEHDTRILFAASSFLFPFSISFSFSSTGASTRRNTTWCGNTSTFASKTAPPTPVPCRRPLESCPARSTTLAERVIHSNSPDTE